ncbi:MAG: 50S ribosomal protein L10 [Planctomycetes bacterium GWC2_49_10]|nr:MAG: 50S ribosomal protein L10 [Planctomycetes bacterium GWC2_49_10]
MSKYVKGLVQGEFEKKLVGITGFMVINTMGMDGVKNNKFRTELDKKGLKLLVVKNTLARRALESAGLKGVGAVLSGPCTLAFGGDSVVDVAKELVEIVKSYKQVEIKGAYVDGLALDPAGAISLSKMPNRRQLQGQVVTLIKSPGARVAGAIMSPARNIAGCIKTIIEKAEKAA